MDEYSRKMGERIKKFRVERSLSQKELAEKVGLAEITIRQYEKGSRQPRIEKLRKISKALGIALYELVDSDWSGYTHKALKDDFTTVSLSRDELTEMGIDSDDPFMKKTIELYLSLDEEGKADFMDYINHLIESH